jgi:hypothetical protein
MFLKQWSVIIICCKAATLCRFAECSFYAHSDAVIPRLTKIIRSGITFVSRNMMLSGVSLLSVSNVNNPVGLVGLPYVMSSAHFFVTHIQTEKISSWNGPTVHVCCFMLARAVLVFYLCPSSVHVVATFPGTFYFLYYVLCSSFFA